MNRRITFLAACFCALLSHAQEAILQGRITDATSGEAIIGANVVYAPGKGGATDPDGRYSIQLPAGDHQITISFVGYTSRTESVSLQPGATRELNVALARAATQLDMVVVTAGRFEQRVGEVTQSLSVLRPEIVLNKNIVSLEDAMDQVPGVIVVDGEPQIRAGSGFSYGAGSRVQVLVDDLPILSGDIGRPNWTFLPLENLEQVEVIKGASSVLYGSAALSGVINVRTAYPRSEPRTRVTMFTGMYDTPGHAPARWWDQNSPTISGVNFFHSRQIGQLDLVLGGNAFSDAGYQGPEPVAADSIAAHPLRLGPGGYDNRIRFNTGLRWRNRKVEGLTYGVNANVMKSRSAAILIWNDIDEGLYRPKAGTVTRTLGEQFYVDPFINYTSRGGMKHSLRTRFHHQDFDNDNGQANSNNVQHAEYQFQQKVDLFGETVITAGAVYRNVISTAELYAGDSDGDGRNTALNTAAYLQLDKRLFDRVSISGGVRYESFTVNAEEASQPVVRAGATWQALKATYLRVSYGQGFRFPTIGERFISTSVGSLRILPSPDLRPEQSTNIEGGVKQGFRIGRFEGYLDVVAFRQDYEDFVEFTFGRWTNSISIQEAFGFGFRSVNTGGARVTGVESELAGRGTIGAVKVMALMGYTWTLPVSTTPDEVYAEPPGGPRTYANTSYDATDNILKFRVQHLFRSDVQLEYRKVFGGISVRYNSHVRNIDKIFVELDESPAPIFSLRTGVAEWMRTHRSGDTIVDARIGAQLSPLVRLAFIVNNLTNEVYSIRPLAIEAPRSFQVQMMMEL
jgi:outer membrane receptor protein involved in Fe transport